MRSASQSAAVELGTIYNDEQFTDRFPVRGQPAETPWRLALVTILLFMEHLPDRQAADAVRSRLDWKYVLSLELTDPGFDHTVLSEFRSRLVSQGTEERLLNAMVELFQGRGWLKARGRQRADSTHVLASVHALNRFELVGETLRSTRWTSSCQGEGFDALQCTSSQALKPIRKEQANIPLPQHMGQ